MRGQRGASSNGAGPEASPDVPPLRPVEVAPGAADEARARGPAPAPQHLVRVKPRLGILFVRIHDKARVRREVAARPFPDIADHLPAARGAVAGGKSAHIEAAAASGLKPRAVRTKPTFVGWALVQSARADFVGTDRGFNPGIRPPPFQVGAIRGGRLISP